ncbi:MAG: YihY/virulence factor BrkB family protein [Acidobacteriota bacterium]|nr:YihY/virulence factor BrkB family protein [Acidobacteriota bacterium]MDQ2840072.1 YihY/virulence factor BrkB family protein [Acidobacteriota bacterium]
MAGKQAIPLLKETYNQWSDHQAPRLGASVAFYSLLSFAPLLILATAVIALVFGQTSAQGALVGEARQWIGNRGAETVQGLLKNAQKPSSGVFASVIAFATLLFGASGVFTELQDALNLMWDVKPKEGGGLMSIVKQRIFSFGMVLSIGFLLLVSLVVSTALAFIGHAFGQIFPLPNIVLHILNFAVSFLVITVLFALMFRYVPAAKISWRDAIVGATVTALLFSIGKFLLGLYLGKASVGSTYGAAGSLVAVIVWIYYSAQIFFFGAEFTHVYAEAHGDIPAVTAKEEERQQAAKPIRAGSPEHGVRPAEPSLTAFPAKSTEEVPAPVLARPKPAPRETRVSPAPVRSAAFSRKLNPPRLLMALSLGFVLGRVFADAQPNKAERLKIR